MSIQHRPDNENDERQIILGFIGKTLALPVTAAAITIGAAIREIMIAGADIDLTKHSVEVQRNINKIIVIYQKYAHAIMAIESDNYSPQDIKDQCIQELKRSIEEEYQRLR
jgi:hypothetical protein